MAIITPASVSRTASSTYVPPALINSLDKRIILLAVAIIGVCYLLHHLRQAKPKMLKPLVITPEQMNTVEQALHRDLVARNNPAQLEAFEYCRDSQEVRSHYNNYLFLEHNLTEQCDDVFLKNGADLYWRISNEAITKLRSFGMNQRNELLKNDFYFKKDLLAFSNYYHALHLHKKGEVTPALQHAYNAHCKNLEGVIDLTIHPLLKLWLVKDEGKNFKPVKTLVEPIFYKPLFLAALMTSKATLDKLTKNSQGVDGLKRDSLLQKTLLACSVIYHRFRGDMVPDEGLVDQRMTTDIEGRGWVAKAPLNQYVDPKFDHATDFYSVGTPQNECRELYNLFCQHVKARLPLGQLPALSPWFETDEKHKSFEGVPYPLPYRDIATRGI